MRALPILALTFALLAPASSAAAPTASGKALDCVDPAELVACVEGTVSGSFECVPFDGNHVSCWANGTWAYRGFTNLPGIVSGDVGRAGGLSVAWCDPGGLCRGVGLGLLIVGCDYAPGAPCGDTLTHSMWLGTPKIEPGECIDFTFTPWIYVWGDFQPAPVNNAVGKVKHTVNGTNGPALQAHAEPSVTDHVCN